MIKGTKSQTGTDLSACSGQGLTLSEECEVTGDSLSRPSWVRHLKALFPFSGPHHILCISTHMLSSIYFVRALDAWQISQWASSVHYLGKKIIQQNPKHEITPIQLSAGLASWRSSEKESSRNQSWQTEKAELPVGWESKGEQNFPHSAAEQSAVSCNFTRSNLARRVQFCNSFKLTSAGTASVQPPHPSLHWC